MTSVQLGQDLEYFIHEAVRAGLYSDEGAVIADAIRRLRNTINKGMEVPRESSSSAGPGKKLTKQSFHRHLVNIGLLDPPPETNGGADASQDLIDDEGDIVDEVVIRERLIEWLTGFLEK
jgi:Arc/MetJ-type ribon-helix-helix transcriptional regulator